MTSTQVTDDDVGDVTERDIGVGTDNGGADCDNGNSQVYAVPTIVLVVAAVSILF